MIDAREVSADVRVVGNAGAALGKELLDIITEGVMQNAMVIRDFAARKKELLQVHGEYLYWFSTAVCLYFAKMEKHWDEAKVTSIIAELTTAMARSFRYTSASLQSNDDTTRAQQQSFTNLQTLYEGVCTNFDRATTGELFKEKADDDEASESLVVLNMLYLSQAYPGSSGLFCSLRLEELQVLSQVQGAFGVALWSAYRRLQWEA